MFVYDKKLQYPVRVSNKDVRMAKAVLNQYGGADGEMSASMNYLTQRFSMPLNETKAVLTDIGTEELGHMEMVATLFKKLIHGATKDELIAAGMGGYFANHETCPFLVDAAEVPWEAKYTQAKGDPIADLYNDMAAEQKARATYENLILLTDDPLVKDTLRWLREREIVHFQRFGEGLRLVEEYTASKRYF
ncbi:manganese catalase family protein [Sedimentibacter saalensis]|uniref:Spore coat protein JC n=2 Tax=root TaxID=1 RepID=A0A562JKR0_9FIRM|nr:manganese catalase family protein [Sedimentibacter saalensis]MEA5095945.1 manganese catalase family protein [Sedimentibacter saalensis]TWH83837.1 spore coat protein JC [Sedimentibacter saalensis]